MILFYSEDNHFLGQQNHPLNQFISKSDFVLRASLIVHHSKHLFGKLIRHSQQKYKHFMAIRWDVWLGLVIPTDISIKWENINPLYEIKILTLVGV